MNPSRVPRDGLLRIVDANANRVREGLRVVEDYARFVCDDASLAASTKSLRHRVTAAVQCLLGEVDEQEVVRARCSAHDVGAPANGAPEGTADSADASLESVLRANLKRAQEGLRVLEEYSKLIAEGATSQFASIRFDLYRLEELVFARGPK